MNNSPQHESATADLDAVVRQGLAEATEDVGRISVTELVGILTERRDPGVIPPTTSDEPVHPKLSGRSQRKRTLAVLLAAAALAAVVARGIWWSLPDGQVEITGTTPEPVEGTEAPAPDETAWGEEPTPDPTPDGPATKAADLLRPEPGYEVGFGFIGGVSVGDRLEKASVESFQESGCGYWGGPEAGPGGSRPLSGLVSDATSDHPVVMSIEVRSDAGYRTASGVGIGTSLETLRRVYGDDLTVDMADGWEKPTNGLLAYYQPVAAVRNGDQAITYLLTHDSHSVERIKVSEADFWGDDEGCV